MQHVDRLTFGASLGKILPALPAREYREGVAVATILSLWRRRYLILGVSALSLLAAAGVLTQLEKRYAAEAVVKLDLQRPEGVSGEQALAVSIDLNALAQSEARIARSRAVAKAVVERLGLATDPRYAGGESRLAALRNAAADQLTWVRSELLGLGLAPASVPDEADAAGASRADTAEERAVRDLMSRLAVSTDSRSYLITITYQSHDPALAAQVANAVAQEYLARQSLTVHDPARQRAEWLAGRVKEMTDALRAAEAEVAAFRERTGLMGSVSESSNDREDVLRQQLQEATAQLGVANMARINEERRLARVQELLRSGQLPSAADLQSSPLITTLLEREAVARRDLGERQQRFGARHPSVLELQAGISDIRSRIDAELRRTVRVISGDVAAARETEADLERRLEELKRTALGNKSHEGELRVLLRDTQTLRDRLATLERSYDQALAARDLRPIAASLILPAEPEGIPVFPRPFLVLALGLVAGVGLGSTGALLLERRDQGLRTSGDLPPSAGTRCLAMVPEVASTNRLLGRVRRSSSDTTFEEAIYAVGAGVGLFNSARGCRTVLVTSSVPGEGKSMLCHALARALRASGKRVLLISGSPLREQSPEAVLEGAEADQAASSTSAGRGVFGPLPRDSGLAPDAYSFNSANLETKLEEARERFDLIILEGAPVMLVADSLVLGREADVVIHVARWAHTPRRVVEAALRRMSENSLVVDGVVLTRVNLRRHSRLHFFDDCSFYVKERRFYERAAGHSRLRLPSLRERI
ncbi:chain length determinant protein [Acetobacteraceae bacterium AT-5844]|nr:chain length determinant protein [Acetobacteraceae bacterium AT-5844]